MVIAVAPVVSKVIVTVVWEVKVHGLTGYLEEQKESAGAYEDKQ